MNSTTGSEWRKWDFHVHTPYSILNNQFGLDASSQEDFDKYVVELFSRAIEKEVWAIGVTDYFSIDGYKRLKNEYLECPEKLEGLFPDQNTRERINDMFIFPNIEFRLGEFISKGSTSNSIDYHVIFSDSVPPTSIEENFIHRLTCHTDSGYSRTLTHMNIEEIGRQVKEQNGKSGSDYLVGLEHVSVSADEVEKLLEECKDFDDQFIITVPVDEDLSSVSWAGRDYLQKKVIYQQCHCYLSSNQKTREWALAEGNEERRIVEFGSIKPCIWGSDAHSFDRMFEPDEHRYCWVKADPTFDGLLQILCEPKDRVAIQEERPEPHDPHRSIKSIRFSDNRFPDRPIPFSESLTCIIGGKSTGKSLLLRQLARAIDPEQAEEREKRSSLADLELSGSPEVIWRDGTAEQRKIIYLPQTFLNRTVDDPQSDEGTSGIIRDVLLQNDAMKAAHEEYERACDGIERKLRNDIDDYLAAEECLKQAEQKLRETGSSELFRETERRLQNEYVQLLGPENASIEEVKTYESLGRQKTELEEACNTICDDINILQALMAPQIVEPSYNGIPYLDALSDDAAEEFRKEVGAINDLVAKRWSIAINKVTESRALAKASLAEKITKIDEQIAELKPKMEHTGKLTAAMNQLNKERQSLIAATKLEDEINGLRERQASKRSAIISSRSEFLKASEDYCAKVACAARGFESNLEFSATPIWRRIDFSQSISSLLDARKFSGFRRETEYDLTELKDEDYSDDFLNSLWDAILGKQENGNLQLRGGAREGDFLHEVFDNWYNVHYIVTSDGDRLDRMSPGKKGLVLLELIIELEQGDCPILIDQPEDDLDNQSIYSDLRKFIKDSKKRRQIIIVTHNANIALGADAEEIIVANQHGVGRENTCQRQFDYRSGAIENTVQPKDRDDVSFLDSCSIQEHVCQILEGGREALEQRRKKYSMEF